MMIGIFYWYIQRFRWKIEIESFNVDDNITISVNNSQKNILDAYFCKICTNNKIELKYLYCILYL